jgi:hypothetical protein
MAKNIASIIVTGLAVCGLFLPGCGVYHGSEPLLRPETAAADLESATVISGTTGPRTMYRGESVSSVTAADVSHGIVVSDGQGGVAIIEGEKPRPPSPNYVNARELRLKARELAEQLIAEVEDPYLARAVALPTSFVNLNNLNQTSTFGRLMAEQLFYEFNQRGFPISEYRLADAITVTPLKGETLLSRAIGAVQLQSPGSVAVVGTYHADRDAIFVNARLVHPANGTVLRTASMVLENNALTKRMLGSSGPVNIREGILPIRNAETRAPAVAKDSPFDFGADIH